MKSILHKASILIVLTIALAGALSAEEARDNTLEQTSQAKLVELLRLVRRDAQEADEVSAARLRRFVDEREARLQMRQDVERQLADEEARSRRLVRTFDDNEVALEALEQRLEVRIGNFGELFGVVRQVAGDVKGELDASLISAQRSGRGAVVGEIAKSRDLPDIADLKSLQMLLLEEMIESARVVRFESDFIGAGGVQGSGEIVRVGGFNLVRGDEFIDYQSETGELQVLARQPAGRFRNLAASLSEAREGSESAIAMALDPTRGQLLRLLIQTPDIGERVEQGSYVGYVIIAMGVAGLFIAIWRLLVLGRVKRAVVRQLTASHADESNPLGRILAAYERHKARPLEALSLALDEAIMRETPLLERHQGIIKVFAALAPLLGLLGTVVGMILTFQQLTLFGTGDPKLMAGGISQALMTTVLGLIVAIPLILLHSLVASASRTLVEMLEEQSVGLIARRAGEVAEAVD